ncbi:glyoxalase family protein [Oceanicola granulosus HTCC2516]|uniref:Glyoxalase family protein n=1 Tax=Oceanicola granulosus (strain ATCC BAA-861 / DSM 15982 / KCTC 12143 / HTCC2516) TaxID=314256 RepID=Q2CCU4_OCEGH|nr:VOC family protein [Oceanicola granulosus]EAR50529.1 glyoxalase family protein [Oceanicola granulosus HTCC2516]
MRLDHLQIAIPAGGEPGARAFWTGPVGMRETPKPAALAGRGGLWLVAGEVELHLGVDPGFRPAAKAHPGFAVPDLDALAERLEAAGHPPRWDDAIAGRRRFFCDDPFGNRLEFLEGRA